ncbi:splicing factor, Prp19-binding domain-containing protein [Crassisporium funariophilum]|nr:splicing factor, Prp19-binding domain-containing protein [Crassisporium funariophilum]
MSSRKQAPRLARPAVRYWKGKAPKGAADVDTDSDADVEETGSNYEEGDVPIGGHDADEVDDDDFGFTQQREVVKAKAMNLTLKNVSVSKEGKVIVAGREESGRTALEQEDEESDEESEEETKGRIGRQELEESSEYESDSEEEEPQAEFRPVFVPKRSRTTIAEKERIAQDTEEALRKKELEAEERRKQSHDLVGESIRRELAEKEKEEEIPDVDDTDGLDPAAEFEAWRLRELGRIKKEKEDELQRENEREEIERRRAMPEEQRMKEDLEHAKKLREEKPKGQQKFLQKYWHKGAFHQDEEILTRHDFTEATQSTVDVSMLPKVMQVKNFGKRSRTKYTHLLDQDTTVSTGGFAGSASGKAGGSSLDKGGCFLCGGPHLKKDCPQNNDTGRPTGANAASALNRRHEGNPDGSSWRNGEEPSRGHWKSQEAPRSREDDYHTGHVVALVNLQQITTLGTNGGVLISDHCNMKASQFIAMLRQIGFVSPGLETFSFKTTKRTVKPRLLDRVAFIKISKDMPRIVKIAVVGTGLAGLTAAYLLSQPSEGEDVAFEVHVFEKASSIGMDSSSISVSSGLQHDWRVDVPMRSFQGGYYMHLIALYKKLGVVFRQADFSYSFSTLLPSTKLECQRITTTLIYNGGSGRAGVSKPSSFGGLVQTKIRGSSIALAQRIWATSLFLCLTIQLFLCYSITLFHAVPIWRSSKVSTSTFRGWTTKCRPRGPLARWSGMDTAWPDYVQTVLVPLLSAVCTAPEADIMNHPIEEILDYIWLTLGTHHYVVVGGVRDVVARLTANLGHVHLSSPIVSIQPDIQDPQCITIECLVNDQIERHSQFHHIIFATQACGAIPLLTSYLDSLPTHLLRRRTAIQKQIECLKLFQYRPTVVINHTDDSLLPDDDRDIRDLNLISLHSNAGQELYPECKGKSGLCVASTYTMATQILPRPEGYPVDQPKVFQTTNPIIPPRKDCLLSVATLERAIVTLDSKRALQALSQERTRRWWQCPYQANTCLGSLQGARSLSNKDEAGVWICGSYAHAGIPLLEGCVVSARNVVEQGIFKSEGVRWIHEPWVV